jgi:hypothetical protein
MIAKKSTGRILTTPAEMRQAARDARRREKTATKIRAARYRADDDAVAVDLSTGATLITPRRLIPGFAQAAPRDLADLAISPGGESLWSDTVDDGVLLEQLVEIAAGEEFLKVLGGRISGRRRSPAKAQASRTNGAQGGRPPLTMTTFSRYVDEALHALAPDAPKANLGDDGDRGAPTRASWSIGSDIVLDLKPHGVNEVRITSSRWPRKRTVERRIRSVAVRLARELARWLADRADERAIRDTESRTIGERARKKTAHTSGPSHERPAPERKRRA